jgi:Fic family protein
MQGFITIKEASQLTGKHADTIRRLIKANTNSKYVAKDRKGRVIINSAWLSAYFEPSEAPTSPQNTVDDKEPISTQTTSLEPVINALTSQLEAKDQQIAKLQSLLSEKEGNTTKLQDQFQQLLARQQLPATLDDTPPSKAYAEPMQTEVIQPKTKPKAKKSKTNKKPQKPATDTPKKKPSKKRWWQR